MEVITFNRLIETTISKLRIDYITVASLQEITTQICNLPPDEQSNNTESISRINATIREYGTDDKILSHRQYKNLEKILGELLYGQRQSYKPQSSKHKTQKSYRSFKHSQLSTSYSDNIPSYLIDSNITKFVNDDLICDIVFGLFTNLSRNVMASSLTQIIMEYFDTINLILVDDKNKYQGITLDIKECFERHGWKCKNATSLGGFYTAPNQDSLVSDFHKIIDKYF